MAWNGMGQVWDGMGRCGTAWDSVGHHGPWAQHHVWLKGAMLSQALQEPSLQGGIRATELSKS